MLASLGTAIRATIVSIILFGFVYPFVITGIAQAVFPHQANGGVVVVGGRAVASETIGQLWTKPQYFHGRPSAAGKNGYDPTATGGTNLGPTSKKLLTSVAAAIAAEKKLDGQTAPPPVDLVTSSASGVDPDISPESAYYQAPRVARARNMSVSRVDDIIAQNVRGRSLAFLGEPHVSVLDLNMELDGER